MERKRIRLITRKDLDISYFVGSGAGGQNKQKNATGVQMIHRESGAMGRCSETRSMLQNRKKAMENMTQSPKFKMWLNKVAYEDSMGETMEETVERLMAPENITVQVKKDGKWVDVPMDSLLPDPED